MYWLKSALKKAQFAIQAPFLQVPKNRYALFVRLVPTQCSSMTITCTDEQQTILLQETIAIAAIYMHREFWIRSKTIATKRKGKLLVKLLQNEANIQMPAQYMICNVVLVPLMLEHYWSNSMQFVSHVVVQDTLIYQNAAQMAKSHF